MRSVTGPEPSSPVPVNFGVTLFVSSPFTGLVIATLGAARAPGGDASPMRTPESIIGNSRQIALRVGWDVATYLPLLPLAANGSAGDRLPAPPLDSLQAAAQKRQAAQPGGGLRRRPAAGSRAP